MTRRTGKVGIRELRHWRSQRFWRLLGVFFTLQCGLGIPLLSTVTKVPSIYWGLFLAFDYGMLAACLAFFLDSPNK